MFSRVSEDKRNGKNVGKVSEYFIIQLKKNVFNKLELLQI